ncbi:MAG: PQQ-binding-like beta-propeller repeat protein [Pirellulales bacterium]|nr:PQQ-binding-like beta-propeller repeat protein [Pirellulales bacterium]
MNATDLNNETPAITAGYDAARRTAWVAWIVVAVICAILLIDYGRRLGAKDLRSLMKLVVGGASTEAAEDPLDSPEFVALREALAKNPSDEGLKRQVRDLDLKLRQEYFQQRRFVRLGAHLLLLSVVVLVVSEKTAAMLRRRLPNPEPVDPSSNATRQAVCGRWARGAVVVLAVVVVVTAEIIASDVSTDLPTNAAELASLGPEPGGSPLVGPFAPAGDVEAEPQTETKTPDFPTDEELLRNWACFRGPHGSGISAYSNLPLEWDGASGKNVLWKTPVPLPGNNSPIVWSDRVFLSGANEKRREVYGFDATTGKLLWTTEAPSTPQSRAEAPQVMEDTGFAAPTMAVDGRRAYAIFANGDVVAVDFDGNVVWSRSLGIPDNAYGHASSLAMYRDRLLIQFDQGADDDQLSKMIALEASTGRPVWQVKRPVANSWSSPIVVQQGDQAQLLTASDPWVIAYDPADGRELWRAEGTTGDQGVTPVVADGLLQVGSEYSEWFAIRTDGSGNVTETHIKWRGEDGLPDTVSPLVVGKLLLLSTSFGVLTCYDAIEGEVLWEKEFDMRFTSSPTLVGDRVFLFGQEGKGWIVALSREGCTTVAETDLGEPCVTSPAMQDGRFYVRGKKHLFCIGHSEEDNTKPE